jgi:DNA anti-recombination protein RmuC
MGMSAEIREVRHTVKIIKDDVTVIGQTVSNSSAELATAAQKIRSLEASLERKLHHSKESTHIKLTINRFRERPTD